MVAGEEKAKINAEIILNRILSVLKGEELYTPISELAERTNLSIKTVEKFVKLIRMVQGIPKLEEIETTGGIKAYKFKTEV